MSSPLPLSLSPLITAALLALLLAGCNKAPADASGTPAGTSGAASAASAASAPTAAASAPPVGVTTVRAAQRDLPVLITATGTVAPMSTVDVRPQVTSLVTQVHVKEGQFVKAGQVLFTLDARADQANVAKAVAQLARDEAALADAQRQLKRSQELLAQNFISQGALDTNQTNVQSLSAAVAADRAALDATKLALSYNRIVAPGAGRLGAINVFVGSSVQANATTLASITQLDPINVGFSLPQRHLADALAALKDGGALVTVTLPDVEGAQAAAAPASGAGASVRAPGGADGTAATPPGAAAPPASAASGARSGPRKTMPATLAGRLKFVDNAVDATTGTVKVKAQFDNGAGKLWPGAFVTVAMTARTLQGAVIIPQAAVIQTARGTIVYAVRDDKAVPRPVEVLYAQGEDAAVSGLKPGERVVLDGRQNLRPGATVIERSGGGGGGKGGGGKGARGASAPTDGASGAAPEVPTAAREGNGAASASARAPAP